LAAYAEILRQFKASVAVVIAETVRNDRLEISLLGIVGLPSFCHKYISMDSFAALVNTSI
jgi:hypothetical protein